MKIMNNEYIFEAVKMSLLLDIKKVYEYYKVIEPETRGVELKFNVSTGFGEYIYNNKAYYKFITVTVLIQPIYGPDGTITSFDFKTIQYNETFRIRWQTNILYVFSIL